jgi:arsenate reductase (thioredoxin)
MRVLFLCQYGGAKSVMAAAYFNRLAEQSGLVAIATAAAAEEPYPAVPPAVVEFLHGEGIEVGTFEPRRVDDHDLRDASRIVSIDCDLGSCGLANAGAERWDDVPKVSEDLPRSASAIRRHVEALVEELRGRS